VVLDAETGDPVNKAQVKLGESNSVETDLSGGFEFYLRPGIYEISPSAREYIIENQQIEISPEKISSIEFLAIPAVEIWPGDTNNDGKVSIMDVLPIGRFWGVVGEKRNLEEIGWKMELTARSKWTPVEAAYADADGNGLVNEDDIRVVASNWKKTISGETSAPDLSESLRLMLDKEMLDKYRAMYKVIIKMEPSEGSAVIAENLRMLIDNLNPERSLLLNNYPNPFNPETWIPFVLSDEGSVNISIYNSKGQLIRSLNMGYLQSGYYIQKDKAAYWDGCNEWGEQISSGVYFYSIKSDNFSKIRKMTVLR
ncbi:T9SS type A sorting domain-containing protein, partial [Candidatus Poribacteria bacterium]|nr:T9SS type A sorting domain-containing protein [Candidatus Poribacteria bacterium]